MKKISKWLVMLLLVGALVAGMILVNKNQETRKGATAAETSTSILPSEITAQPGDDFKVNLWVNTGKDTDKLTGVEITVSFDAAKVKYESMVVDAASGYSLVNDIATVDNGAGKLTLNMVAMGAEKGGAINLAKLNFKALGGGTGAIKVSVAKVLVSGQASTWDVSKHNASVILMDGPLSTAMPYEDPTITPKITAILPAVTATPVPGGACNKRCQKDADCPSLMTCKPLWWSCNVPVPTGVVSKIQNKEVLSVNEVKTISTACPDVEKLLISDSVVPGAKVAPALVGMCRNLSCVNDLDCNCDSGPVANISGALKAGSYQMGSLIPVEVLVFVSAGKVSGADMTILFDAEKLSLENVQIDPSVYSLLNKQIDNVKGKLIVGVVASRPASELLYRFKLNLTFKAKALGKAALSLDRTYANLQVTGINASGVSMGFPVVLGNWDSIEIKDATDLIVCKKCSGEPAKSKGNANCDDKVNMLDFEIWRNEAYDQGGLSDAQKGILSNKWNADFDCDGKVMLIEFEIWRRTVYP